MSLYSKLYPFQQNIIKKFWQKQSWGLFLDMGLGKTPLSLAFAEVNKCSKVLVITLNAKACETEDVEGSWFDWAAKSSIPYRLCNKWTTDFTTQPEIFLVNYESLFERGKKKAQHQRVTLKQNIQDFIQMCKGQNVALIVDESHKVKNLQSQQTISIQQIQNQLKMKAKDVRTYLLTGTPFTQGYIDLYSQLKLLGCTMTKGEFIDLYCIRGNIPGLLGWQQPVVGYKNITGLFNLLHRYAITIKSDEVADLPEQIFTYHTTRQSFPFNMFMQEKVSIEMLAKFADILKLDRKKINVSTGSNFDSGISLEEAMKNESETYLERKVNNPFYRDIDYPESKWFAETAGQCFMRARQLSIGFNGNAERCKWYDRTRLEELKRFLEQNEENYLLFYNYTPEMLEIYDICEELGYNIDIYCGDIKSLTFYEKYCKMSPEEKLVNKKNVIIANFASGSTGLNWQEYNHCIIFSCPTFRDYAQGIKRIHRLGQKQTTFYHVFYQKNWLDKRMNEALAKNEEYDEKMFASDSARIQILNSED